MSHDNRKKFNYKQQPSPYDRINIGEEDELIIEGYVPNILKIIGFLLILISSFGTLLIFIAWKPGSRIRLTHTKCSLDRAKKIVLRVRKHFFLYN